MSRTFTRVREKHEGRRLTDRNSRNTVRPWASPGLYVLCADSFGTEKQIRVKDLGDRKLVSYFLRNANYLMKLLRAHAEIQQTPAKPFRHNEKVLKFIEA